MKLHIKIQAVDLSLTTNSGTPLAEIHYDNYSINLNIAAMLELVEEISTASSADDVIAALKNLSNRPT